jgi:restriction system protein
MRGDIFYLAKCKDCNNVLQHEVKSENEKCICDKCKSSNIKIVKLISQGESQLIRIEVQKPKIIELSLKSIVQMDSKRAEGFEIISVALPWIQILKYIKKNPEKAFEIPHYKWEEIIAGAYKAAGFDEVILTPRSGDFGKDVIAIKHGIGSVRIIDQVKAYKPTHLVPADDVRALLGVVMGDKASKGFLTTTSDFSPRISEDPVYKNFIPSRLELINGKKLFKRLNELII